MLYYSHQWRKSANDYRELLTLIKDHTDDDNELINLLIKNNKELQSTRPPHTGDFLSDSRDIERSIIIRRNEFFQQSKAEQISIVYKTATELSISEGILDGLENICTQGPLWLTDYVLDNWIGIQNEKYKEICQPTVSYVNFEGSSHQIFKELPDTVTKNILSSLTNIEDFYSMKLVCKTWYILLHRDLFWRELYLFRYRSLAENVEQVKSWKLLYFLRLESKILTNKMNLKDLMDATSQLRDMTAGDVLQLWDDLTHQDHSVEAALVSQINYILSNSYYYYLMEQTLNLYSVGLIVMGLSQAYSRTNIILNLHLRKYDYPYFTDIMKELTIECEANSNKQCLLNFKGPDLFGFEMGYGIYRTTVNRMLLTQKSSEICPTFPSGLIICLFILMVHPGHRKEFIEYLKGLETRCLNYMLR